MVPGGMRLLVVIKEPSNVVRYLAGLVAAPEPDPTRDPFLLKQNDPIPA